MGYSSSDLDRKIKRWFKNDDTCATLHSIELKGQMRSLKDVEIEFDYPITAFAGKNGSGKTTLLAMAACAYHNNNIHGYKLKSRKRNYYTFSDFFIQTQDEIRQDGITIGYKFLHNSWKGRIAGIGYQRMQKRKGGKWSKYEKRINKNVVYLGIDRIVPQTEKKVFKSYIKNFQDGVDDGWYKDVKKYVGQILGKNYSEFKIKKAGAYNLQLVKETGITYSGFNMGAGEKALFELFSIIHECSLNSGKTLIIIDEIELGLHEEAQRKLIHSLKEICDKFKFQIVCTTHSAAILDSLPPEGRFYIDKTGDETVVIKGISGAFAAGRLAENHSNELDIYVEDEIAVKLITACFKLESRQRVGLIPVGSFAAVCRQLSSAYRHPRLKNKSIAILDGDQRSQHQSFINKMISDLELSTDVEKSKFKEWIRNKLFFLPGSENPEKWIISQSLEYSDSGFAKQLGVPIKLLKQQLECAVSQPTHGEFYYLSKKLSLDEDSLISDLTRLVAINDRKSLKTLCSNIEDFLE